MPLPKPKDGEEKESFIKRCMSNSVMKEDYTDNKQRLAVCFSQWKNKDKKSLGVEIMERRNVDDVEYRFTDEEGNTLTGYAARFNVWSEDLGFFREKIQAGAFKKSIEENDIRALFNHDPNLILGRTKNKTLELWEDDKGLGFNLNLPDTTYATDLKESIKRKDITQNSFGFQTLQDEWSADGKKRTLIEAKLFDISPVTFPAYKQTSVKLRFLDAGIDFIKLKRAFYRSLIEKETSKDKEIIQEAIEVFNRYLKESEPVVDHSEADPEPAIVSLDPATRVKMIVAQIKSRIGANA